MNGEILILDILEPYLTKAHETNFQILQMDFDEFADVLKIKNIFGHTLGQYLLLEATYTFTIHP